MPTVDPAFGLQLLKHFSLEGFGTNFQPGEGYGVAAAISASRRNIEGIA